VMYLNVDGLTNLAIAEGTVCRFTRVVGGGLEGMASELAERRGIALTDARRRLAEADLSAPAPVEEPAHVEAPEAPEQEPRLDEPVEGFAEESAEEADARERSMSYEELAVTPEPSAASVPHASDADVFAVLENGIREISGEVRNSLDFHRSQDGGGDVSHVVLSGSAQEIPGFVDALQLALGVEVRPVTVGLVDAGAAAGVSPHRLAVATGLAATEVPHQ
jgi:type IV pilus assembly protein PilM